MSNHGEQHWANVCRILRYVASTLDKGITYTQPDGSNPQLSIQGWSDAALGECMDTRKSRLGTLVIVNGAFVTGKSARLKRVVTSSTGAEVYALSAAAREMVAVRNQLRELQHPIEATSTLRGDNQSSLLVATTPGKHRSSLRHLELHAFQVKDFVDNGEIDVVWCPGDDCIADVYTKAVDTAKFKRFSSLLLGDGPTTIEKALVVNAVHSYHVDHVLNGKSVCLGGVCGGGVGKTSRSDSAQAVPDPAQGAGATVPVPALRGQVQAKQPSCISPAQPSANT